MQAVNMSNQTQNFWNFSVALYARARVADACLELQNSYGLDVNMLLFCYWHGIHLGEFTPATLSQALSTSLTWKQEVVQPLRNVRQWMKIQGNAYSGVDLTQFEALRARIKFDELGAEKYQQELLEQVALANAEQHGSPGGREACARNIENYFAAIQLEQNDLIAIRLKTIGKAVRFEI